MTDPRTLTSLVDVRASSVDKEKRQELVKLFNQSQTDPPQQRVVASFLNQDGVKVKKTNMHRKLIAIGKEL